MAVDVRAAAYDERVIEEQEPSVNRSVPAVASFLLLAAAACGGQGRSPTGVVASSSAASSGTVDGVPTAVATPPAAAQRGPYDASTITRRIDDPALASVKPLVAAKKWKDAAFAIDALAKTAQADECAALNYLSATYRGLAGNPKGSADAFVAAAKCGGPLASYASFGAARSFADLGEFDAVLAALSSIDPADVPRAKTDPLRAKALLRTSKAEDAFVVYREILARREKTWAAVSLELARALLDHPGGTHAEEAARLALDVSLDGPTSREGEAKKLLEEALSTMRAPDRKPFEDPPNDELARRGARLVAAGRGKQALAIATKLEKRKDDSCGSVALRARALAAVGRWSEATTTFEVALTACGGDASTDGARLLFDAGRAASKGGNLPRAIARFTSLEETFRESSLVDDARVERAKAALENSDDAAFVGALATIATDHPAGDLTGDGLLLLAVTLAKRGDWSLAIPSLRAGTTLGGAPAVKERAYHRAGRFDYFLGRALAETGDKTSAAASYRVVLDRYPLSYYAALACARADELEPGACKRAFDEAKPAAPPEMPDDATRASTPFRAAELLAALDDAPMAMVALDALGVGDRSAAPELTLAGALLLARTSHPALAHLVLRSASESEPRPTRKEASAYRDAYPIGAWRSAWDAAYPRPFADSVGIAAKESSVPEALLFAVMREESAFDPNAVSKAGALGLTQIMPFTGRRGAKALALPDDDAAFLDPAENIRIGAHFLKQMRGRFADNVLLALPAYNAGPLMPEAWTKERPGMAFDLFVEDVPYTETRNYTKRVIGTMFVYEVLSGALETGEASRSPALARAP